MISERPDEWSQIQEQYVGLFQTQYTGTESS